ncbi:MAG: NusG domain II-containing protein [Actinobacteria bacterium]|nr:NusG domain II-containing protein [Actinomycetota bacterium]
MGSAPDMGHSRRNRPPRGGRRPGGGRWWAPGDVVLVLTVAALSALLIAQGLARAGAGSSPRAAVSVNGREVMVLSLQEDRVELAVEGYRGRSYLQVAGGRVRMLDSACPDKLCVHAGWISRPGESIVCLPNRVVIEIKTGEEGPDVVNR